MAALRMPLAQETAWPFLIAVASENPGARIIKRGNGWVDIGIPDGGALRVSRALFDEYRPTGWTGLKMNAQGVALRDGRDLVIVDEEDENGR